MKVFYAFDKVRCYPEYCVVGDYESGVIPRKLMNRKRIGGAAVKRQ